MQWEDTAIILEMNKYSESLTVISCITEKYGLRKGAIRITKANKSYAYPGNVVEISWSSRLEEHLGKFTIQSCDAVYPYLYNNQKKLISLLSICSLCSACLAEKEPQNSLYRQLEDFIYLIKFSEDPNEWIKFLLLLEFHLLSVLGFGLDVSKCVVTNTTNDIAYISPKTGKAVSKAVGEPYKDRLFKVPKIFINSESDYSEEDLKEAFNITKYFFKKHLENMKGVDINECRNMIDCVLFGSVTCIEDR